MKKLYKTIDGSVFNNEQEALSYENKLKELSSKKVEVLNKSFLKFNEEDSYLVRIGKSFDEAGNSRANDLLEGTKKELIQYISLNKKYWFYNNCEVQQMNEVIKVKKELE